MALLLATAVCPNCGAPHSVTRERRTVICIFCNASLRVEDSSSSADASAAVRDSGPRLTAQTVSKDEIERVKQLLIDGKRAEAVAHYARVAGVSAADAEAAVENVFLTAYWTLVRHLPMNAVGFLVYAVLVVGGAGVAAWAATQAIESPAYFALVIAGGLFALLQFVRFLRSLSGTLVSAFGAVGRGRVLRRSVVREMKAQEGFLLVVLFEVAPDGGGAAFVDQETLFVGHETLEKLAVGNVVRVRFNGARSLVFPSTPVTVLPS